jgi:pimeloyl-ACP methyl ester carboxylesterase/DNA-binding CsgD family transcriptional regulator
MQVTPRFEVRTSMTSVRSTPKPVPIVLSTSNVVSTSTQSYRRAVAGSIKFLRSRRGARIAYTTAGSGPPLISLPAWAGHLEGIPMFSGFAAFERRIARNHTLICYDRWGTGLSDRERDDFSIEADLDDLVDVVDSLHLRRFAVFAPSHGGPVGIELALRYPQRISHLVLYATMSQGLIDKSAWEFFREFMLADADLSGGDLSARATAALVTKGGTTSDQDACVQLIKMSSSPETAVALMDRFLMRDRTLPLGEVRVPTLVLQRRDDAMIPAEEARTLASQIPGARLELIDGEAHIPFVGDGESVADRICAFTSGAVGGPSAQLTPREAEILDLVAAGSSNAEAAQQLVLSVRTVERHLLNAYRKLGVRGRAEAAAQWAAHMRSPT